MLILEIVEYLDKKQRWFRIFLGFLAVFPWSLVLIARVSTTAPNIR